MSWLRWTWVPPLLLGFLLDLGQGSPSAGLALAVTAAGAASILVWWCLRQPELTLGQRHPWRLSVATLAVAALSSLTTAVSWMVDGLPSAALLWIGTVATGAVLARSTRSREVAAALVLGLATALGPVAGTGADAVTLVLLALVAVGTSAAIGWQVRERRRRVAHARAQAVAEERAAMALELHDSVAHEITGIIVLSQAARAATHGLPEDSALPTSLEMIESASTRALNQVRDLVSTLRDPGDGGHTSPPHDRSTEGAGSRALRRLAEDFAATDRMTLDVHVEDLPLGAPAWLGVQRIAREALTNVRRHASGAQRVSVRLVRDGHHGVLTITDDGRPSGQRTSRGGLGQGLGSGLQGISDRATALGGAARAAPIDDGWQVMVHLPLLAEPASVRTTPPSPSPSREDPS